MLSRRLTLAGPALAGLSRKAAAQYRREDAETDIVLLSADGQPAAVRAVNDVVARITVPDVRLHAQAGRDILDTAARLANQQAVVAAMLPSVSLAYMMQSGLPEHVVYANCFIGRMGVTELHVLASRRVSDLRDLAGQKVAVGLKGSATQGTAAVWLERVSLRVEPLYLELEQALTAVLRGQIPAMMLLAPKPARLFFDVNLSDNVHFLPIGVPIGVPSGRPIGVFPTQILPSDYPLLSGGEAGGGRPVTTVGVPLVLACYNWPPATPLFMGLARLSDLLIQRGSGLRGFDMAADVPGWQRFPPVVAWLARGGTVLDAALALRQSPLSAAEKERLFQQFLNWRRHH
ncbi:MAG: TAXI family TRAP transporter solute-binding subunit [Rhodopila sp.]